MQKPILDNTRANISRHWLRLHQVLENMQKSFLAIILVIASPMLYSEELVEEVVSFRCGLAVDAVIAEMDKQSGNLVTQEALSKINDENGEFVCVQTEESKLFVSLQTKEMGATENRLIFTIDPQTYRVIKTYYGR
ncbi:MAG: hypothetical protein OEV07_10780 [Gammaproteobacteria bacterium]|nr:hypothetical protein [Gammaproteobacteria bacterium]